MNLLRWRRGPSRFRRASDGSMTLVEHLLELRSRLFKATVAVALGMIVGYLLAQPAYELLEVPYCSLDLPEWEGECPGLQQLNAMDAFILKLKLALWIGLILAGPVWFYQLWAFVAPGLHRRERRWAYVFVGAAVPLFAAGAVLAYVVIERGLRFLVTYGVEGTQVQLEVTAYISFISTVMLVFAVGFLLPLLVVMLNFAGVVSARKLLGWWRVAVLICFTFAAFATPDPGPFGMLLLATILTAMYFGAVGIAFLNDYRKAKRAREDELAGLDDDELSPLPEELEPVGAPEPLDLGLGDTTTDQSGPPGASGSGRPPERRYDDLI